jgi:hypothetical protein
LAATEVHAAAAAGDSHEAEVHAGFAAARSAVRIAVISVRMARDAAQCAFQPPAFGFVDVFQSIDAVATEFAADGIFDEKYFMALPGGGAAGRPPHWIRLGRHNPLCHRGTPH